MSWSLEGTRVLHWRRGLATVLVAWFGYLVGMGVVCQDGAEGVVVSGELFWA